MSNVRAIFSCDGPASALAWLNEVVGNEDAAAIIVITVDKRGGVDPRLFGPVPRYSLAFAGAILSEHSVNGDFEADNDESEGEP